MHSRVMVGKHDETNQGVLEQPFQAKKISSKLSVSQRQGGSKGEIAVERPKSSTNGTRI